MNVLREYFADFNQADVEGRVSLETSGGRRDRAKLPVQHGDAIWLSDGEVAVGAYVEDTPVGMYARPVWSTVEHLDAAGAPGDHQSEMQN